MTFNHRANVFIVCYGNDIQMLLSFGENLLEPQQA